MLSNFKNITSFATSFTTSFRQRIFLVALLPLLLAVSLFAIYFIHRSTTEAERSLENHGQISVKHLAIASAFELISGNSPQIERFFAHERRASQFEVAAITDGTHWLLVAGNKKILPKPDDIAPKSAPKNTPNLCFSHVIHLPTSGPHYFAGLGAKAPNQYAVICLSRAPIEQARSRAALAAFSTGLLAILFALMLAWRLAGQISKPLLDITRTVAHLASGELTARTQAQTHGEIGQLEIGINRMAQTLEENQRNLILSVKAATAELLKQKLAADAAVLAKTRFLAATSHDLRQPLHALTLLVAALRDHVPHGEAARLAKHIESSALVMESLLNTLLDLSKLDAGVVQVKNQAFHVEKVFQHIHQQFHPVAQMRGLRLLISPTKLWCYSDPILLERILANLVSNALRYSEKGWVLVSARREASRAEKPAIRFEVRDTGNGIPLEYQTRIFEEYFQLANPERQRDKGLGLGLAIVTRLVRLLNSETHVCSKPGQGSRFSFSLPRCATAQADADAPAKGETFTLPLEHSLIAFIDDDESILDAMVNIFDQWNVALAAGSDAEQVRAELHALGRAPDLILCDYRLREGRTGIEAVQLLRDAFGAHIPAAIITGDTATETIQSIQSHHLPVLHKPLKPAKLRAFLSHLLSDSSFPPPSNRPHS